MLHFILRIYYAVVIRRWWKRHNVSFRKNIKLIPGINDTLILDNIMRENVYSPLGILCIIRGIFIKSCLDVRNQHSMAWCQVCVLGGGGMRGISIRFLAGLRSHWAVNTKRPKGPIDLSRYKDRAISIPFTLLSEL